jgi:hypothetical protein
MQAIDEVVVVVILTDLCLMWVGFADFLCIGKSAILLWYNADTMKSVFAQFHRYSNTDNRLLSNYNSTCTRKITMIEMIELKDFPKNIEQHTSNLVMTECDACQLT